MELIVGIIYLAVGGWFLFAAITMKKKNVNVAFEVERFHAESNNFTIVLFYIWGIALLFIGVVTLYHLWW
jgi:hypothetical protein